MKVLIFLLLMLSQSIVVNCTIFSYVRSKLVEFSSFMVKSFEDIGTKIKNMFVAPPAEEEIDEPIFVDRPLNKELQSIFQDLMKLESHGNREDNTETDEKVDPVHLLATPQMAFWHGREMESHMVQTKDGYFLTVHRINANPFLQANRTVLLHHGLLGSSIDWILLGPKKSLPYILSDAGYDVWLTNARGNYYSRGHLAKNMECKNYWNFSWQEMGLIDLPAIINYIRNTKNVTESINFVGHSMGATALLVLLSSMPEYNEYLRVGVLLAPLAYMNNIKGPLKVMSGMSEDVVKLMGSGEFLPHRKVPSWLAAKHCKGPKIFCNNPLLFLTGIHHDWRWNASFVARLLYHVPAGGSTNTLLHYMQVAYNGKFHKFNDPDKEFPVKTITLPIALISSSDDWLANTADVLRLYFELVNPIDHHIIRNMSMTHTDFVWGADAHILVFEKVVQYLEKGIKWNMQQQNEISGT